MWFYFDLPIEVVSQVEKLTMRMLGLAVKRFTVAIKKKLASWSKTLVGRGLGFIYIFFLFYFHSLLLSNSCDSEILCFTQNIAGMGGPSRLKSKVKKKNLFSNFLRCYLNVFITEKQFQKRNKDNHLVCLDSDIMTLYFFNDCFSCYVQNYKIISE